jgi:phosphoribosyl 1,2-cyclic phosphodiesterase
VDDAVAVARRAECGRLALFHHDPGRDDAAVEALEQAARVHLPGAFAAREGEGLAL